MPKPGKETKSEHWTKLIRTMMEEPAWRALSPTAQALYPWLKLEWRGPKNNNNGRICLSVRQAAHGLGVSDNTAAKAFHDLQAKGFIVQTETPCLGVNGAARGAMYELTELACNKRDDPVGRKLYKTWTKGSDFPVKIARANNPYGRNGKTKPHRKKQDVTSSDL